MRTGLCPVYLGLPPVCIPIVSCLFSDQILNTFATHLIRRRQWTLGEKEPHRSWRRALSSWQQPSYGNFNAKRRRHRYYIAPIPDSVCHHLAPSQVVHDLCFCHSPPMFVVVPFVSLALCRYLSHAMIGPIFLVLLCLAFHLIEARLVDVSSSLGSIEMCYIGT